ncbi:TIGR04211 family SH3 domain-containing protein [Aeromonas jandaei]|uniref:TIGR04211 family SH3 domain-containing protein n=1 Tax=Aeromonas jandaei TaxID=650 RepID=A0ABX6ZJW0_AERJA|nr:MULTISPECIES: TIGR04211 family SH3 domain-containing protein [Aeromonas]KIQ83789.1 arylsulfatase [Aeromonas sp. L_1B5_3]MBL0599970.1 TIGR04211 family SH3 domain-containing protein [Aeromonas jandaei]MBL0612797.1 TIGR04211 family SH3 domain-containing protein [Aeromonas jandaei]MBL0625071.1 TIGR04211 family SH3 domain-containing protein [Aeromonas jandaei]MBL0639663.1 TIGR04211 family SH3 domain-containing protein [Aeromonas veronii]
MRALLGILICLCAQQALADTRYVSDNIFTFIHNGPGTQYRILGSVKAGEPLEVKAVNGEAGFTQVVDGRGRDGWIKSSELQSQISLREQLPQVEKERDELKARLQNLNGDNEKRFAEKDGQIAAQSKEIAALKAQLASQGEEMNNLKEQNDALTQSYDNQEHDMQMDWFIRGGAMVGAGILLGILLPMLPRRRSRGDRWMN